MADKFVLDESSVNTAIEKIASALNSFAESDISIKGDINNTEAYDCYKTKVETTKTLVTQEFPTQLQSALRNISSKVESLKDMEQKLKEMITKQNIRPQTGGGQGGNKGFGS